MSYPSGNELQPSTEPSSLHFTPSPGPQFCGPDVTQSLAWREGMADPRFKNLLVDMGTDDLKCAIATKVLEVLLPMKSRCPKQTLYAFQSLVLQEISNRVIKVELGDPLQDILDGRDLQAMIGALSKDDSRAGTNTAQDYLNTDVLPLIRTMVQEFSSALAEGRLNISETVSIDQ